MKCPKCNLELFIDKTRYVIKNETAPKLFYEQDMVCRNEKCANHDKVVETVRSELPISAP